VDATFDLGKTGKICLPVQTSDGKKTFWQQGPPGFSNFVMPTPTTKTLLLIATPEENGICV
ncbi:hypothetical protein ABT116_45965, partial [Streptomyces sp. NPDC002130]